LPLSSGFLASFTLDTNPAHCGIAPVSLSEAIRLVTTYVERHLGRLQGNKLQEESTATFIRQSGIRYPRVTVSTRTFATQRLSLRWIRKKSDTQPAFLEAAPPSQRRTMKAAASSLTRRTRGECQCQCQCHKGVTLCNAGGGWRLCGGEGRGEEVFSGSNGVTRPHSEATVRLFHLALLYLTSIYLSSRLLYTSTFSHTTSIHPISQ
jgi:hypothetical protein